LRLKANLENLTKLKPDGEDFRWYLKVSLEKLLFLILFYFLKIFLNNKAEMSELRRSKQKLSVFNSDGKL
jgi:hypothetical protein